MSEAAAGSERVTAREAGRGGIAIAGAKLYFMVAGLVQQILLARILGTQGYGAISRVQSLASMVYNPVVSTAVQGVSRTVAASSDDERPAATRRALSIHAVAIVPLAALFFLAAPAITAAMNAPHLTAAMRIISGVLFLYGLYTPLVGVLNGRKRFKAQAGVDALFATLRTVGLLCGAWYFARRGLGVEGAIGGFVAAAAVILAVTLPLAGVGRRGEGGMRTRAYLLFVAPLLGGQVALNLLLQSDLQLLGRFAADAAELAAKPAQAADTLTGAYRAAQLFSFLPYQLLLAVTFVLFPLLATAHRDRDHEAVARYITTGVRLAFVLCGLMVSVTAGLGPSLLRLVFPADTAAMGAAPMFVLALGLGAFAIFGILVTVLTSLGRERLSALLTIAALLLVVGLCFALVRGQPFGEGMLSRTAVATSAGLFAATLLAALAVKKTAGAVVPPATVVRVLLGLAAAVAAGRALPSPGKPLTVLYALLVALAYLAVLVATRELGRQDLDLVKRVAGRGR